MLSSTQRVPINTGPKRESLALNGGRSQSQQGPNDKHAINYDKY